MRIALSLMLAAALGCSRSDSPPPPGGGSPHFSPPGSSTTPTPFREGIELADSQSALENGQTSDRFNFSRMRELWVRVKVAGMTGTTVMRLTLTTPAGSTFFENNVAYSPDRSQSTMNVPNAPHPITVFPAQPLGGGHGLVYVVPVVGTALARYPAPGRWRVAAAFEGGRILSADIDVTY